MPDRTCSITGCTSPTRSAKADWCKRHYHRWYRHGDPLALVPKAPAKPRYRITENRTHPLATPSGKLYVHRQVLFDAIGAGPHDCHWCGTAVDWFDLDAPLQVDHLDEDKRNNELVNLVPACGRCNSSRTVRNEADARRAAGWFASHDTVRA